MDKKAIGKLKMEKPAFYDSTDERVAIIPRSELREAVRISYRHGLRWGSLVGALGLALSALFTLVTAQGFNDFFGIKGPTWEAIFILVLILSSVVFVYLIGYTIWDHKRGNPHKVGFESKLGDRISGGFFQEEKRVKGRRGDRK